MPKMSVAEAARTAGTQRSTLYRAMENGKLSYEMLNGRKVIDPSELERVFPSERPKVVRGTGSTIGNEQPAPPTEQVSDPVVFAVLRKELELVREQNRVLIDDKEDLRTRLDASEQDRRSMILLLEDLRKPRPSWWQFWAKAA